MNGLLSNLQIMLSVKLSATSCKLCTSTARRCVRFSMKSLSSLLSKPSFSSTARRMSASCEILA